MKNIYIIAIIFGCLNSNSSFGQNKDTAIIYKLKVNRWIPIRLINSVEYSQYLPTKYFQKKFSRDSLYIGLFSKDPCLPKTLFIGEYTNKDSLHIIDYAEIENFEFRICFEGLCGFEINRNHLPQIRELSICNNTDSLTILEFNLYIQSVSGVSTYLIKGYKLPNNVIASILNLKAGNSITIDNVKVLTRHGIRTIEGAGFLVTD